jgi:coenzyme F420-0:L-glutamate ligase
MNIKAIKTRIFKPNEDLLGFLDKYIKNLKEGDVIVITSKIVALAEGRIEKITSEKEKEKIIKKESEFFCRTKYVNLTVKDGVAMANAGIDESNANNTLILLPKDSFATAKKVRKFLQTKYKIKNLAVIITDSRCIPLRAGTSGVALGYAGFKGIKDYRGKKDIFNRTLHFSRVNVADSLATAAVFCMGEGNEQKPLAIIRGTSLEYRDKTYKKELKIDIQEDLYGPLFKKIIK